MTVEGLSPNALEDMQIDRNEAARVFAFFILTTFQVLAGQTDLSAFTMLRMLGVDAAQLQVSGLFR